MEDKGSKLFNLVKTAFGVLLASIAAAAISHHYKTLEKNNALSLEARKAATSTYYDVIDTIGKRHFYALRATIGLQYKIAVPPHLLFRRHETVPLYASLAELQPGLRRSNIKQKEKRNELVQIPISREENHRTRSICES